MSKTTLMLAPQTLTKAHLVMTLTEGRKGMGVVCVCVGQKVSPLLDYPFNIARFLYAVLS